ncbi:MAG: hypothetical protein GC151_16560 [Betaproteobacteria bacterium]|nr:hypothetical protein [Betaproteobacteria bacterium]
MRILTPILLLLLVSSLTPAFAAQEPQAGQATSVTGVVSVQRSNGAMGIVGRGSTVRSGDTVFTQPESRVVIEMQDGARLTIRPSSQFRIENYRYVPDKPQEDNMFLRLVKGGLRTLTGLLGKRRPTAFQLNTGTATIGVRGTDFLTRICEDDCARETKREISTHVSRTPGYVGRLIAVQGTITPTRGKRAGKPLSVGDPVYSEDILESAQRSYGVIIFQDGTRIVLKENTRFVVERFKFEPSRPEQGNVVFRLLRGGLRALTGLIAHSNNKRFQINTAVATIGVRGTGFDALCTGACADDGTPPPDDAPAGLTISNWQGCNVATNDKGEAQICEGQALNVASADEAPKQLDSVPGYFGRSTEPRPDKLQVDLNELFGIQQEDFSDPGVYVQVNDGTVTLKGSSTETFTLRKGEVGYIDPNGSKFVRLGVTPVFMDRDVFVRDGDPEEYGCFMR